MNTTKPTEHAPLPKRDAKTGRFEKAAAKPTKTTKPVAEKAKAAPVVKPAADKPKKS